MLDDLNIKVFSVENRQISGNHILYFAGDLLPVGPLKKLLQ